MSKHNFKVLTDAEHMLARPGMYIGSVTSEQIPGVYGFTYQNVNVIPGLLKIINEIIDNSVDEHIRTGGEFATKIDVLLEHNLGELTVTVSDNGRGLPQHSIDGIPIPVLAWTRARSGSNFTDDRATIGMNGVGSFAAAVFSTSFIGSTTNESGSTLTVNASKNCSEVGHILKKDSKKPRGTTVEFCPDLGRFNVMDFSDDHKTVIKDRLHNLAVCFPGIQFSFNGEKIKFKNTKELAGKFSENSHFLNFSTGSKPTDKNVHLVLMSNTDLSSKEDITETFIAHSYVNGLNTRLGGAHVEFMMNKIVTEMRGQIKKKYKFDVSPSHVKAHLFIAMWCSGVETLQFDSQTKERVTNTQAEMSAYFDGIQLDSFIKKILADENIIMPIVAAQVRKAELAELAEIRKKNKDADKANLRKIAKFTDAIEKRNRRNCMLFITEGDSANTPILAARTPMIGAFPLRGKPLNALGVGASDVLNNKEMFNLLTILGLKVGEKVRSLEDLRFGKIVLCTDADVDGAHISGLMMATFYKFWPELFSLGAVYRFRTPIAKTVGGKVESYFYSMAEFKDYCSKNKSAKTRYLKGLGSSSADDFRKYFSDMDKNLVPITIDSQKDLKIIDLVFGKEDKASDERKVWLDIEG